MQVGLPRRALPTGLREAAPAACLWFARYVPSPVCLQPHTLEGPRRVLASITCDPMQRMRVTTPMLIFAPDAVELEPASRPWLSRSGSDQKEAPDGRSALHRRRSRRRLGLFHTGSAPAVVTSVSCPAQQFYVQSRTLVLHGLFKLPRSHAIVTNSSVALLLLHTLRQVYGSVGSHPVHCAPPLPPRLHLNSSNSSSLCASP